MVQGIPVEKLIKLHLMILKETFDEQVSYRIQIPEGLSREETLNMLTSGGF
jgi:hypothetical protein